MIRINLLPLETQAAPSKTNPLIPIGLTITPVLLILTPLHLSNVSKRSRLQAEAVSLQKELERYQPIIAQVEALEQAKAQLQQRKSVIQQLENERLRYPQFMDDFVKLLPGNIWLTSLVTTQPSPASPMNVSMDVVALDNYSVADLISNLETSQVFTNIDVGTISMAQAATGQTLTFHVSMTYQKMDLASNAPKKS